MTPFSSGSNPRVNRRGDLFIAYESAVCQSLACDQPTDHDALIVAVSHDHGRTFTNQEVALDFDFPFNADIGRDTLTGENFRINSFPQLTIDPVTDALLRRGPMTATVSTTRNRSLHQDQRRCICGRSLDGTHWSPTLQMSGSTADEVYPAVAAYGGKVAVSFYTRAYDPKGIGLDYAYVSGNEWDLDSLTHSRLHRVTTQTSNPQIQFVGIGAVTGKVLQGEFIGDYTAVAHGR